MATAETGAYECYADRVLSPPFGSVGVLEEADFCLEHVFESLHREVGVIRYHGYSRAP